jgi:hypothetical protein
MMSKKIMKVFTKNHGFTVNRKKEIIKDFILDRNMKSNYFKTNQNKQQVSVIFWV